MTTLPRQQLLFNSLDVSQKTSVQIDDKIKRDFETSAKTSIFRAGASAPIKVLLAANLFSQGSSINYGKGRYNHDTNAIAKMTGHCVGYDYVHHPEVELLGANYQSLYSGYVVNTLPPKARQFVWQQMASICKGVAFIAARTDKISGKASEDGVVTSIGTFQKSYKKNELKEEALEHFKYAVEIKGKSGFSIVACSNQPLDQSILSHSK